MSLTNRTKSLGLLLFSSFMLNFIPYFNKGVSKAFESLDNLNNAKDTRALMIALDDRDSFRGKGAYAFMKWFELKKREERLLEESDKYEEKAKKDFSKALIYGMYKP